MGIQYEGNIFYGIKFDYEQVKHLPDLNFFQNGWGYNAPPHFDARPEDNVYIVGIELSSEEITIEEMKEWVDKLESENEKIKKTCQELKLEYTKPKIINTYSVW